MPSRFQGLVASEAVPVDNSYAIGAAIPANTVWLHGVPVLSGSVVAAEDDGAATLTYLGGLAYTAAGLLVVDSGTIGTTSRVAGLLVNERGALHVSGTAVSTYLAGIPFDTDGAVSASGLSTAGDYLVDESGNEIVTSTGDRIEIVL